MEVDPVLIIVVIGSVGGLLIERVFYYKSKYGKKPKKDTVAIVPSEPDNPGHGERIKEVETELENLKENNDKDHALIRSENEKDHRLIRGDVKKLFNLLNGMRK